MTYLLGIRSVKSICVGIVLLSMAVSIETAAGKERVFSTGKHGRGELRYLEEVPVAIFTGTAEEIGEQHAALLGKSAAGALKFPKKLFSAVGAEKFWFLAVIASNQLLTQAPERYRQEIAAIAKHARIDSGEMGVANTLLELRRLGCSTLIIEPEKSATGGPLFGRNFDFPALGLLDKYSLVTVIRPQGKHAFAAVGYPGLVGVLSGMNDAGLAVATLDVYESGNKSPKFEPTGVPLMLVFRQILEECTTLAEAEQLLKRTKATTWANLAVCDRQHGAVFEITPTAVARRDPSNSVLPCTNHFRSKGFAVDTKCWRYEHLQTAAKQSDFDVPTVHQYLHQANQGDLTLHTMVFEPRELVLHLAIGKPPSSALPLRRLDLRPLLLPKNENAN